jgi:hypothetical protein
MTPAARTCATCRYVWPDAYRETDDWHRITWSVTLCCVDPPHKEARTKLSRPACFRYEHSTAPERAETDDA